MCFNQRNVFEKGRMGVKRERKMEMVSKHKTCTYFLKSTKSKEKQSLHPHNVERFFDVVKAEPFC